MKFCKNLQRVIELSNKSNPEWSPFWVNYKALKKLILKLPSLVPMTESCDVVSDISEDGDSTAAASSSSSRSSGIHGNSTNVSKINCHSGNFADLSVDHKKEKQQHNDEGEIILQIQKSLHHINSNPMRNGNCVHVKNVNQQELLRGVIHSEGTTTINDTASCTQTQNKIAGKEKSAVLVKTLSQRPGEIAFFQLLHSELKKAIHFFDSVQEEFEIREQRMRDGMSIITKQYPSSPHQWSHLAHGLVKLNKDLLMLETYAIMSFCSFSKILKKHDKVTGFNTREAFMEHEVKKANFADYPRVLNMIDRCESLFEEVWDHVIEARSQRNSDKMGSTSSSSSSAAVDINLFEDERLFIYFIHQLNEQAMETAEDEGAVIRSRDSCFYHPKKKLRYSQLSPSPSLSASVNQSTAAGSNAIGAATADTTEIPFLQKKPAMSSFSSSRNNNGTLTAYLRSIVEQYGAKVQESSSGSNNSNNNGDDDQKLPASTPVPFS